MGFPPFSRNQCAPVAPTDKATRKETPRRTIFRFFRTKPRKSSASKEANKALGGTFLPPESLGSSTTGSTAKTASWKSCDSPDYKLCSLRPSGEEKCALSLFAQAIQDSKRLPQSTLFSNNHIMVNTERTNHGVPALKRVSDLDSIARSHAENMAAANSVFHTNEAELLSKLKRTTKFLGENVAKGTSIKRIHKGMMKNKADMRNITDKRYKEMGMATARGPDGEIFLCQIFRR